MPGVRCLYDISHIVKIQKHCLLINEVFPLLEGWTPINRYGSAQIALFSVLEDIRETCNCSWIISTDVALYPRHMILIFIRLQSRYCIFPFPLVPLHVPWIKRKEREKQENEALTTHFRAPTFLISAAAAAATAITVGGGSSSRRFAEDVLISIADEISAISAKRE